MRLVIIGGVAAGMSAATKARRTSEEADITVYEKGEAVSYANCGLPYHVGGVIADRDDLLVASPAYLKRRFRIDVRLRQEVESIDRARKTITVRRLADGSRFEDRFDRLVIATGAEPASTPGWESDRLFPLYTLADMDALNARISAAASRRAAIFGGGYVGIEAAENLHHRGFDVTVVHRGRHLMKQLDPEMATFLEDEMRDAGVTLMTGTAVEGVAGGEARLAGGGVTGFDVGVRCLGVRPSVRLAQDAGIMLGATGAIAVDRYQRTSVPDVFAAGDCAECTNIVTGVQDWLPLAGPANKHGRVAGHNAVATDGLLASAGVLGTSITRFGKLAIGSTGLSERSLRKHGIDCIAFYYAGTSHAGYYPGAEPIYIKVTGSRDGRLLGAQVAGRDGVDKRLDVFATAITAGMTFDELEGLDLAYAPPYSSARDPVIVCGMIGANIMRGVGTLARMPAEAGDSLVIDVRTRSEHDRGTVRGAVNIPLDELRDRAGELEAAKQRPVIVHCATGHRSYNAVRLLRNLGFTRACNLSGGYLFHTRQER